MQIQALVSKAHETGNPVIKGETVTFIWQGRTAPRVVDDLHNWEENPQSMQRAGPGLWSYSLCLDKKAYLEYGFIDPKSGERIPDPLNSRRTWNGVNSYNNYFYMPGGGPSPVVQPVQGIARGILTKFKVPTKDYVAGTMRSVILYQPPTKGRVPLLVVYDGTDYKNKANINTIADNLIAQKRVRPFAMALIKDGGQARTLEYSCSDSTLGFLCDCVIPLAKENLNLLSLNRGVYGVMGASLGGLMALYTGLRLPGVFGNVLSQSGAFLYTDVASVIVELIQHIPVPKTNIWMDAGLYEGLLNGNRQMHALLKDRKYKVKYHEFSGGHNFTSWRNDLWRGLEALFR